MIVCVLVILDESVDAYPLVDLINASLTYLLGVKYMVIEGSLIFELAVFAE